MALRVRNYGAINKFSEPADPVPSPHSSCSIIFCKFSDFEYYTRGTPEVMPPIYFH
jgi:hypothetical protein